MPEFLPKYNAQELPAVTNCKSKLKAENNTFYGSSEESFARHNRLRLVDANERAESLSVDSPFWNSFVDFPCKADHFHDNLKFFLWSHFRIRLDE